MKRLLLINILLFSYQAFSKEWNIEFNAKFNGNSSIRYGVSKKLNNHYSLGLGYLNNSSYRSDDATNITITQYTVYSRYWFDETYEQGQYIGADLTSTSFHYETSYLTTSDKTGTVNGIGISAFWGYQWMWKNFNLGLSLGLSKYGYDTFYEYSEGSKTVTVTIPYHQALYGAITYGWAY